ncbi:hypothetical protein ABZ714_28860 [Streptomyces sp. NPDC006798]|uniref:hypothetical protein n=1 Tax=Streptomyces sp. NPDC006798 TaxID=3155462 RepID=UPI0033FC5E57
MRTARFLPFASEALSKAPDIQDVTSWDRGDHTKGLKISFTSGAQLWVGVTMTTAPGERIEQPESPVHGDAPDEVALPDLYEDGKITPDRAKKYIAAALTHAHCDEIETVYPYSDEAANPGVGVKFHNGSRIYCLFTQTARPGQGPGGKKYDLQSTF